VKACAMFIMFKILYGDNKQLYLCSDPTATGRFENGVLCCALPFLTEYLFPTSKLLALANPLPHQKTVLPFSYNQQSHLPSQTLYFTYSPILDVSRICAGTKF